MNKYTKVLMIAMVLLTGLSSCAGVFESGRAEDGSSYSPLTGMMTTSTEGFSRAVEPMKFQFPRDHGPHEDFQTEWWYYTGNLVDSSSNRYGYQLTFFRRALSPPAEGSQRTSSWAVNQVYLAHFTISQVQAERFYSQERFSRGAAGLAGAQGEPFFQVWLDDWQVKQISPDSFRLQARTEQVQLDLTLTDTKGPVLQGNAGLSPKGPQAGNASYYISQTRLESKGKIRIEGRDISVSGLSWMDHEFSTSALAENQVGWDWFSLQLDNQYELMVFTLRDEQGNIDAFSSGTIISPDGSTVSLEMGDFSIQILDTWRSPHSGAVYPSGWRLQVPEVDLDVEVYPLMKDQELRISFIYWEGAVKVNGRMGSQSVSGYGYVELTGYAQSMQGRF